MGRVLGPSCACAGLDFVLLLRDEEGPILGLGGGHERCQKSPCITKLRVLELGAPGWALGACRVRVRVRVDKVKQ